MKRAKHRVFKSPPRPSILLFCLLYFLFCWNVFVIHFTLRAIQGCRFSINCFARYWISATYEFAWYSKVLKIEVLPIYIQNISTNCESIVSYKLVSKIYWTNLRKVVPLFISTEWSCCCYNAVLARTILVSKAGLDNIFISAQTKLYLQFKVEFKNI